MADKEKRIKAVFQVDSTGFNSSLKNINSSLRNSQSELKLASEGIKSFGRSSEKLKSVQESLNKQVELQSKKVNIYKESIEKTSKKLEENIKTRDKLKDSLEKANKKYDEAVKLYGKESEQAKKAKEDVNNLTEEYKKKEKAVETNTRSIQNYETNMNKANTEMVKAQGELKKVSGELDKNNNKWLKSSENLKKSSEKLKDIGGKVSGVGDKVMKMTAPITAGSVASLKFSADFSDGMAKVGTIADKTKVPITKLREGALGLSKDFGVSATEITESMYQTISASVPTEKAVKFVGIATKAAKAGFTEASVAVDGLSTVLNSYGIEADKADKIANQMLITQNKGKTSFGELASSVGKVTPIAASLGVTTEELFSSLASTTAQGLATSESVTALSAAMSNIIKPSEGAAKAADALGLEFNANAVKTKGWIGFLQDVKSKLEQSSPAYAKKLDEVNKLRHAIDGAGKSSKNYKDQLEKEKEKIKQLQEAKKNLTSKDKDRKQAIDTEIKSIQEHVKTMQKQSKTEKEGIGNVKEMKKALSGKEKELKILEKTSQGSLSAFAQMFGSVNGLNDVLMLTSENGMKIYNETMQEMKTNTHALDDAFNEMSNTPGEKFRKSLNAMKVASIKFGDALMPLMEKGTQVITKLADTLNNLSKEQIENYAKWSMIAVASGGALKVIGGGISTLGSIKGGLATVTGWLGKFSTGAKVAEGGAMLAGKGFNLMGLATKASTLLMNPWTLAIAGVGIAGVVAAKQLNKEVVPQVDLFADKVVDSTEKVLGANGKLQDSFKTVNVKISEGTKKAVGSYMDMDKKVSEKLNTIYFNSTSITEKTTKDIAESYKKMSSTIGQGIDTHYQKELENMRNFFANSKNISKEEQTKILKQLKDHNQAKKQENESHMQQIQQILNKASAEKRALTQQEMQEINTIQNSMKTNAITHLSEEEVQSKAILERLKQHTARLTTEQASIVITNAEKQRKSAVDKANKQCDETIANIIRMRDETKTISSDQADKLIKEATRQKDESIKKAEEMKNTVVSKVRDMNGDTVRNVDTSTGKILTGWGRLKRWWDSWHPQAKNFNVKQTTIYERQSMRPTGMMANWTGSNYFRGGLTTLHERGEEIYDLPKGTRIYNAERSEQLVTQTAESVARKVANSMLKGQQGSNGNSLNINMDNVYIRSDQDIKALAQEIAFYIKQNNLGTGGVY